MPSLLILCCALLIACGGSQKGHATTSHSVTVPATQPIDYDGQIVGVVNMCLNRDGKVKSLRILKSTGHTDYDAKIKKNMWQWKYAPFLVSGKAVPVCTTVTFIYIPEDAKAGAEGAAGGACYGNGSCNTGLTCASSVCVRLPPESGLAPASE